MKSYTDIEQSKKLAEILPLESADMHYGNFSPKGLGYENKFSAGLTSYTKEIKVYEELKEYYGIKNYNGIVAWEVIPCWSLAALLNILHSKAKDIPSLSGGGYKDGEYISDWCLDYEFENGDYQKTFADNPLDACVAMIEKLYELKIL